MDLSAIKTEELVERYCNAYKTYQMAGGHTKAANNEYFAKLYAAELNKRGEATPDSTTVTRNGIFNGNGAT